MLSLKTMPSSRFKNHLLEYSLHPIITNSLIRENSCVYSYLVTKERYYSTLIPSLISCVSTNSCISTTLDYLVSTSLCITIKLDFNEKTLTPPTLELLIFDSIFTKNHTSFSTVDFKLRLILF